MAHSADMIGLNHSTDSVCEWQLPSVPDVCTPNALDTNSSPTPPQTLPKPTPHPIPPTREDDLAVALEDFGWFDMAGPLREATGLRTLEEMNEFLESDEDLEKLIETKGLTRPQLRKLFKQLKKDMKRGSSVFIKETYPDGVPDVEIALRVKNLCHVDTTEMSFEVDLLVCLDWADAALAGIPARKYQNLDWQYTYFNPDIIFDNSSDRSAEAMAFLTGADTIPRIAEKPGIDKKTGMPVLDNLGRVQLKKTMRWRGDLQILHASLNSFPFDMQVLPIVVKSVRHAACPRHRVKLVDPESRLNDSDYRSAVGTSRANRGHLVNQESDLSMYQFRLVGITGQQHFGKSPNGDIYQVSMLVQRPPFSNYVWDLLIMNLLLLLAATSLWSSSPELSLRMGIALTVLLTTAAYNSTRPKAIEFWPNLTFQDWSELMTMCCATAVAIFGVFSSVVCGGQHVDAPQWLVKVTETWEEDYPNHCDVGWCFARDIDCTALTIGIVIWFTLLAYSMHYVWRTRRNTLSVLKDQHGIESSMRIEDSHQLKSSMNPIHEPEGDRRTTVW